MLGARAALNEHFVVGFVPNFCGRAKRGEHNLEDFARQAEALTKRNPTQLACSVSPK